MCSMRNSGVSPPLQSCNVATLTVTSLRFLAVRLLDGKNLYFAVEPKSKTKELYNQTCVHLSAQGMLNTDLFGLAFEIDGEYMFIDPDSKISKYAPKNWKASSTNGLDNCGRPLLTFYLRVQFYVDSPALFRDDLSRHYYYLQLRQNVTERELSYGFVEEEVWYVLAGLALQADYGDHTDQNNDDYFPVRDYFPQQMLSGNERKLRQSATIAHRANRALSKTQAEFQYIRDASSKESFPVPNNSHLYKMKRKKQESNPGSLYLAICTRGIELHQEKSVKSMCGTLYWNSIKKLSFDRKKFEIRSPNCLGEKMTYYTSSDEKSKHLLLLCRLTHQFYMSLQTRLADLAKKEEEEKCDYREWGIDQNLKLEGTNYGHCGDQRISVISNTSSNTTSGIVSDRVHSLDESEDDLELEIMINSPPAASLESLALAHLKDSFRTSEKSSTFTTSLMNNAKKESNKSPVNSAKGTPTTPALTDGSQCSSSCSTVVINGIDGDQSSMKNRVRNSKDNGPVHRRHSTNSSLELGYSHTAQNSVMSDSASCLELDCSVQSAHTSSGIYTLQSSCETNTVATATAICSSETSGICNSIVEDSEGCRTRSGSMISVSGSFHGDGSDPSDTGHRTPLTAEELSDLIVGRGSPKPCRGKYPPIATVSESLDSVADYVTLPPPPVPPQCCAPTFPKTDVNTADSVCAVLSKPRAECYTSPSNPSNVSNVAMASKYLSEEAMLQRQIQFQHLAAGYSPQLLLDTLPGQSLGLGPSYYPGISNSALRRCCENRYSYSNYSSRCPALPSHKSCSSLLRMEETGRFVDRPQLSLLSRAPSLISNSVSTPCQCSHSCCASSGSQNMYEGLQGSLTRSVGPVVGSNNYLDVRRSGAAFLKHVHEKFPPPPPPPFLPRQPPPPLPQNTQYDQYRQQLYSDVDYVMYPIKDPALSRQEYLDFKLTRRHIPPPPLYPYSSKKSQVMYRSTPNVASVCLQPSYMKYSSNQNLASDTCCTNGPCSSSTCLCGRSTMCSTTASLYSSTQSLVKFDTQHYAPLSNRKCKLGRTLSDDSLLNCSSSGNSVPKNATEHSRPPPPLCTLMETKRLHQTGLQSGVLHNGTEMSTSSTERKEQTNVTLDICSLREKSRNLDLPLISALCNDRSLLQQTNTIDVSEKPLNTDKRPVSWHINSKNDEKSTDPVAKCQKPAASKLRLCSTKQRATSYSILTGRLERFYPSCEVLSTKNSYKCVSNSSDKISDKNCSVDDNKNETNALHSSSNHKIIDKPKVANITKSKKGTHYSVSSNR